MATHHQIQMRGKEIETRPVYVEEWLDSLPYIDFQNATTLMHQALQAMNAVPMKSTQRMELVTLFHRPYKYYLDTQIRTGAQHTLQTMEVMQNELAGMKSIAIQLARASRLAMDEALTHKSLWGQNKYPLQEILMTITYLSHTLIYSFLEYAPTPQKLWQELNFLFQYAENLGQQQTPVKLVATSKKEVTSIEQRYKRILLIALADPYHLPFGAIWEIYEQLHDWTKLAELKPLNQIKNPEGQFVVNLAVDSGPLPYEKFNPANKGPNYRLLDTNGILVVLRKQLQSLGAGKKAEGLLIAPFYADYLLGIIEKSWSTPSKRDFPRKPATGHINLMHGLNATYYFVNGEKDFNLNKTDNQEEYAVGAFTSTEIKGGFYKKEAWDMVDISEGGIAVTHDGKPQNGIRVGDVVSMNLDNKTMNPEKFRLGIIRWLLLRQGKTFKTGIEIINKPVLAAGVRARHGNQNEREFRRAILLGNPQTQKEISVITSKGLFTPERDIEINVNDKVIKGMAVNMLESTTCFEQFSLKLQ